MTRYLASRLAWSAASLLVFVSVTFVGMSLLPYDYATRFGRGCPGCVQQTRGALGLDRPLWIQLFDYLGQLLTGSLGEGFSGRPVLDMLTGRPLSVAVLVFGVGAVVAFFVGTWVGRVAAWRAGRLQRSALNTAAVVGLSIFPPLLVFVLLRFSYTPIRHLREALAVPADEYLDVWAVSPWTDVGATTLVGATLLGAVVVATLVRAAADRRRWPGWTRVVAPPAALGAAVASWALAGAWIPAMTVLFHGPRFSSGAGGGFQGAAGQGGGNVVLAIIGFVVLAFGETALVVDASMAAERGEHYLLTARAKGLPDRVVRDRHALRNAFLPAMTRFVVGLPLLLTGLIIVERELELRGLSTVFLDAALDADIPLVTGALVVFGVITLTVRLGLEVLLAWLDPRIRARART